jgi:hypothetical protein
MGRLRILYERALRFYGSDHVRMKQVGMTNSLHPVGVCISSKIDALLLNELYGFAIVVTSVRMQRIDMHPDYICISSQIDTLLFKMSKLLTVPPWDLVTITSDSELNCLPIFLRARVQQPFCVVKRFIFVTLIFFRGKRGCLTLQ